MYFVVKNTFNLTLLILTFVYFTYETSQKTQLMLCRNEIGIYHTHEAQMKHSHTPCGKTLEFLMLQQLVRLADTTEI